MKQPTSPGIGALGIGLAGAGFVADVHAEAYKELRGLGVELKGVSASTLTSAQTFAERHGIGEALPFEELLTLESVDIIDLCVPNQHHEAMAVRAAQAGKHVICEKPLTGYFGEGKNVGSTPKVEMLEAALKSADAMIAAAKENGVKLMYAENWLYSPVVQKAKRLVRESGGTIFEIRGEESHHGSHSAASKRWETSGGGALIRLGSHPIGAALHLKHCEGVWRDGAPVTPVSVSAEVADLTKVGSFQGAPEPWIVTDWQDVETWATVIITFSDGTKGVISANDVCLGGMKDTLDIFMSNARIHCDFSRSNALQAYAPDPSVFEGEYLAEKLETKAGWSFPSIDESWLLGYQQELRDFVEAVKFNRAPLSDAYLGRNVLEVIYSAYLSAEQGKVIKLKSAAAARPPA